jgi:xanthine dehydrogenase small subunit
MIQAIINNKKETFDLPSGTVLLDVIRQNIKLTGTKEGCREGDCGSCIVLHGKLKDGLMIYRTVNSCMFPLGDIAGSHIVTVEGLNGMELTPVQQALVDKGASQCGFCTPGFVVSMTAYFMYAETLKPDEAIGFLSGNICRCTGYTSIIRAMEQTMSLIDPEAFKRSFPTHRIQFLVEHKFLPEYFLHVPELLTQLAVPPATQYSGEIILAGGTDLYVQKEDAVYDTKPFLISSCEDFKGIYTENGFCHMGAATTVTEMEESSIIREYFPQFSGFVKLISSTSIRNRATVGGNIINASPIGDLSIILLALDATVVLRNHHQKREVRLKDFFKGYKQLNKQSDELLHSVYFPLPHPDSKIHFEKVSRRTYLDIAGVNSAMLIRTENNIVAELHLSAGGIAPIPKYFEKAVAYLKGKTPDQNHLSEFIRIACEDATPISDVRGSTAYKKLLLKQILQSYFRKK